MIRTDGYYQLNSVSFEDSIANYSIKGFYHKAYLFLSNGTYIKASKKDDNPNAEFTIEDFNSNFPNKYLIFNNQLIVTHYTGQEWEFSEVFQMVNDDFYINEKQKLTFTSW